MSSEQIQDLRAELLNNLDISSISPFVNTLFMKRIAVGFNQFDSIRNVAERLRSDKSLKYLLRSDALLVENTHRHARREFHDAVYPHLAATNQTATITTMTECGDPHKSGITLRIELSDGTTWYRKNKVSTIENDLQHAYDLINHPSPFHNWPTIHTKNSTWQKAITHAWATNPYSYFFNYGILLAIMSFMHVSDLHHENVICDGTAPIPVDFEVANLGFIHSPAPKNDAQRLVDCIIASFPTSTGMVPLTHSATLFGKGISPLEIGTAEAVSPYFDTDHQKFMLEADTKLAVSHLPISDPQLSLEMSWKFAKTILEGFDTASTRLISRGKELKESIFHTDNVQRRALIRHTTGYSALITKAFCHATDCPERFITNAITRTSKHLSPDVKKREIECLRAGAIPKFTIDVTNGSLWEANKNIKEPIIAETLNAHRFIWAQPKRLEYWYKSSRDLLTYCLGMNTLTTALPGSSRLHNKRVPPLHALQPAKKRLVRQIEEDKISSPLDNSHAWISVTVNSEESVAVSTIPDDVYFGSAGVIKGLRRTTKLNREDCEDYYAQLNKALHNQLNDASHSVGYYKGVLGMGSELKRLAPLAGVIFPEREFIKHVITESLDRIGNCQQSLDMLMGVPGVIYALSRNSKHTLRPLVAALIAMIHDHDSSELVGKNYIVDNVSFAHGASGIIASSAEYARHHRFEPYLETAVLKLLKLERELGNGSLKDVRYGDDIDSLQWCNGSGGALISRALLTNGPLHAVKEHAGRDIEQHLPSLIKHGNTLGNDCVCHGVAGSILILEFLQAELLAYRKQLAIATASFRKELAQQIMTTGALNATGMSQHSKGLLVGSTGILCALEPNNSVGIVTPEW